ncbi:photosystem II protein, Psb35-related [Fischerella sp. JS2]|uniref:photosystem II protein, Psb35-related n=1 Tax=Fischerella sp. JS2 TaxID=2597771 RepID=UPI0037BE5769
MMTILIGLFIVGWVAASLLGSMAYFLGEQRKPIHERNWRSESFEKLAKSITGKDIDYSDRTPAYGMDAYASNVLPN